jgi:hypothetical protein
VASAAGSKGRAARCSLNCEMDRRRGGEIYRNLEGARSVGGSDGPIRAQGFLVWPGASFSSRFFSR